MVLMKHQLIVLLIGTLLLSSVVVAQENAADDPLMEMMSYIPDTLNNRRLFGYGDTQTWGESWGLEPISGPAEVQQLFDSDDPADVARAVGWAEIVPRQTFLGSAVGLESWLDERMRPVYGFDWFMTHQSLQAGAPPRLIGVYRFDPERATLAESLTSTGYTSTTLEGGTLYSFREDGAFDLDWEGPAVGQFSTLNRIAQLDNGLTLIAPDTASIELALTAHNDGTSLADNLHIQSLMEALNSEPMAGYGPLVGLRLQDAVDLVIQPAEIDDFNAMTVRQREAYIAELAADRDPTALPGYSLVGFSTNHTNGRSYYALSLVLLEGADAQVAAEALRERMEAHITHQGVTIPMFMQDNGMVFEAVVGVDTEHFPVAIVVLSHPDPSLFPEESQVGVVDKWVFRWEEWIFGWDLGFLALE